MPADKACTPCGGPHWRFASSTGDDLGPLPYVNDATPGLYGTLWTDTHLTIASSPYHIGGDLTVAPSASLLIDHGVTLIFSSETDIMGAGTDNVSAELLVQGTIQTAGRPTANVTMQGDGITAVISQRMRGQELVTAGSVR